MVSTNFAARISKILACNWNLALKRPLLYGVEGPISQWHLASSGPITAPGMLIFANHLEPLPSLGADLLPVSYFVNAIVKLKHLVYFFGYPPTCLLVTLHTL